MSKRQYKAQASSSRAASGAGFGGFGLGKSGSSLSYLTEPPSLSAISDANVVVAFKNLLKKDSTTKSKGLEDLRSYVQSHPYDQDGGAEEPILEAWVKIYSRISIDNSRRVRELSHNLQYELLKSARKRMEKHIPGIVGAWLAGTYDRDRPVSKAAKDGIESFLDTDDKMRMFWRRCQLQILDYAQEAIAETSKSLSDERTTNADDAQAKYDRVIGASLSLVLNLLIKLSKEDTLKFQDAYNGFLLGEKNVWKFIADGDSFVRRTTAQLLLVCLDRQAEAIGQNLELISSAFVGEGLRSSQASSALVFAQSLDKLTSKYPDVWTAAYKGKKPAISRLRVFVAKGSQNGPAEYWQVLSSLLLKLPNGVLPEDLDGATDFLKTLRDGISSRDEMRTNNQAAWNCYFELVNHFNSQISNAPAYEQLIKDTVYPVFEQFLRPAAENARWSVGNSISALAKAFQLCARAQGQEVGGSLEAEWDRLVQLFTTGILTSLPEQSKDYSKSQTAIVAESHRWFGLQAEISRLVHSEATTNALLVGSSDSIIKCAIDVLVNRNGKPYGAAGTLEAALRVTPQLLSTSSQENIASFLLTDMPKLIVSPSSSYLIASLGAFRTLPGCEDQSRDVWQTTINTLLDTPESLQTISTIQSLISNPHACSLAQQNSHLQNYLHDAISKALQGDETKWALFESAFAYDILEREIVSRVMVTILGCFDMDPSVSNNALRALEFIIQKQPQILRQDSTMQMTIMTRVLSLTESPDASITFRAVSLKSKILGSESMSATENETRSPIVAIVQENLETAGPQSLSIDTLVNQTQAIIGNAEAHGGIDLFPKRESWYAALQPLLEKTPDISVAMTNILSGAVFLIPQSMPSSTLQIPRDLSGYSVAFRMALYTAKLLQLDELFQGLPADTQVDMLLLLSLTLELANDQLGLLGGNELWSSLENPEVDIEVQEFIVSAQQGLSSLINRAPSWRDGSTGGESGLVHRLISRLIQKSVGFSSGAFYAARALGNTLANLVEAHGWQTVEGENWINSLGILKTSSPNLLAAIAVVAGLKEGLSSSKIVNNLCNRLVSDVTGVSVASKKALEVLVLMNTTLAVYEQGNLPVAQNRLVFAVKQLTSWMDGQEKLNPSQAAEACRSLQYLFPSIKEVYGPYWESSIEFCVQLWTSDQLSDQPNENLPAIHASLKLLGLLRGLEDPNDDLDEALVALAKPISHGLLTVLGLSRTNENQPWRIVDELLYRHISRIPLTDIKDITDIYPLVASDYRLIQSAAFNILHRATPAAQEQISVDVLLEHKDAQLPDELLSLLLEAPAIQNFSEEGLAQFPASVRSYLLAWQLVFDSYVNASYKVRNDYTEELKSEQYILPFLNFLFDVLGHSAAHPLSLDRARLGSEQIKLYSLEVADTETDEYSMQWQLVHLYYLCLKFTPNLVKNWWIDCKSKQTRIAVEAWTEKYFSPLVILDALDDVATWSAQQESSSEDEKELIVKVSRKSREVYAGCEVDEMQMQIVIRLPAVYPLEGVKVDGVNRVAVSEKKWQSWLMITQGVITFSNGSITDGLAAFRRNVTGALKGQTECAICYSIISSDKKMPDKRCQTCKNLFHSSCLFKWFATSNQSSCPLCRNPFNFAEKAPRRRPGPE